MQITKQICPVIKPTGASEASEQVLMDKVFEVVVTRISRIGF